jgi:hypothetical protein
MDIPISNIEKKCKPTEDLNPFTNKCVIKCGDGKRRYIDYANKKFSCLDPLKNKDKFPESILAESTNMNASETAVPAVETAVTAVPAAVHAVETAVPAAVTDVTAVPAVETDVVDTTAVPARENIQLLISDDDEADDKKKRKNRKKKYELKNEKLKHKMDFKSINKK